MYVYVYVYVKNIKIYQFILQAFKRYFCKYKEWKGHTIKDNQQHVNSFVFQNKPLLRMNEEIHYINNKWLKMKGKMKTLTFFKFYSV